MAPPPPLRRALRFALAAAVLVPLAAGAFSAGCGPYDVTPVWVCFNPVTMKDDVNIYDPNHYVNGVFDPCHCYDPCGPEKTCPIVVDAGPPPADAGCMAEAGGGTGGGDGG